MDYDSKRDIANHIERVRNLLRIVQLGLSGRGQRHDQSKMVDPELGGYQKLIPLIRQTTYGSEEYERLIKEFAWLSKHHHAHNSHHPEFYENGVSGMTLLDIVEMFCDWKAATERSAYGNFEESIQMNRERFKLSDQLVSIFENTRKELEW